MSPQLSHFPATLAYTIVYMYVVVLNNSGFLVKGKLNNKLGKF